MAGFVKLYETALRSTLWDLDAPTRVLFITMLLMKDSRQVVDSSVPGLAKMANLTLEETEAGLDRLQEPDPYSRSVEHDGRRVIAVSNHEWEIVNGSKYRDLRTDSEVRAQTKKRVDRKRSREDVLLEDEWEVAIDSAIEFYAETTGLSMSIEAKGYRLSLIHI